MSRGKRIAIVCLALLTPWMPASGQRIDDAVDILKMVRKAYDSLKSFELEGVTVIESKGPGMQSKMELSFKGDFIMPTKMRIETKNPMGEFLIVGDGHTMWLYSATTKTYTEIDMEQWQKFTAGTQAGMGSDVFTGFSAAIGVPFDMLELTIAHGLREAKILGEEDVELEGKKLPCYVVQAEYAQSKEELQVLPSIKTFWIDKGRYVVLRESFQSHEKSSEFAAASEIKETSTLTKVRLNEGVPDDLFVFTPPEGAKKAEPEQTGPRAPNSPQ